MKKSEIVKAEDFGLKDIEAKSMTKGLAVVRAERELLIKEFNEVSKLEITKENIPKFKELRNKIVKNRTQGVNKWHKAEKEFFLTGGRFVDAVKNRENAINESMESVLMDAEKHFENIELERLKKLQIERVAKITKYVEDAEKMDLSGMSEDVFNGYLFSKKTDYDLKIENEKKAEEERIKKEEEERKEKERKDKEIAKLKAEAEAKEKAQKLAEEERQKAAAKKQAEFDARIKAEEEAKAAAQAIADAKQKELEDIKAKQEKEKADAEKAEQQRIENELKKGDAAKFKDFVNDLESIKTKYNFKSKANKKKYEDSKELIDKIIKFIS
jgi:hypothetical protein